MQQSIRDRLHISHSQITTYRNCPLKYFFRYVQGIQPPFRSPALVFGSAMHQALATLYSSLKATGDAMDSASLQELFHESFSDQLRQNLPIRWTAKETAESLEKLGCQLMEVYLEFAEKQGLLGDAYRIVAVELPLRWTIDMPTGEIDFVGIVDLLLQDKKEPAKFHIIDHKTAARRFDEMKITTDDQLTAYQLLLRHAADLPQEALFTLHWDVLLKQKVPAVTRYTTVRDEDDERHLQKVIRQILWAIDHEVYYPNPGWMCAGCEFADHCRAW